MPDGGDGRLEARCCCSHAPLLAVCGRDTSTGEPFVHVKSYKGNKLYTEVVATSGTVWIRCRDCYRWHRIDIKRVAVERLIAEIPDSIAV